MHNPFNVYFDEAGVLHIAPCNNIEAMALKHLEYEVGEHSMAKMIVIETEVPIKLPADKE